MRIRRSRTQALLILVVVVMGVMLVANEALAVQWGPRRTVGSNGKSADHSVAVGGAIAHVLYEDYDADGDIRYRRSTDGGNHWGLARTIQQSQGTTSYAIAASGKTVIVLLTGQNAQGHSRIWIRRSTNSGVAWQARVTLADETTYGFGGTTALGIGGNTVVVAWTDPNTGEIIARRSADAGAHWAQARTVGYTTDSNNVGDFEGYVSVAVASSRIYVLWLPGQTAGFDATGIRLRRSVDKGAHWLPPKLIATAPIQDGPWMHAVAAGRRLLVTYIRGSKLTAVSSANSGRTTHSVNISTSIGSGWTAVALRGAAARAIFKLGSGAIYMRTSADGGKTWQEGGTVDVPGATDASLSLGMGTHGFVATWYESVDPPSAGGTVYSRHGG